MTDRKVTQPLRGPRIVVMTPVHRAHNLIWVNSLYTLRTLHYAHKDTSQSYFENVRLGPTLSPPASSPKLRLLSCFFLPPC